MAYHRNLFVFVRARSSFLGLPSATCRYDENGTRHTLLLMAQQVGLPLEFLAALIAS
jgi:hypothetical protein